MRQSILFWLVLMVLIMPSVVAAESKEIKQFNTNIKKSDAFSAAFGTYSSVSNQYKQFNSQHNPLCVFGLDDLCKQKQAYKYELKRMETGLIERAKEDMKKLNSLKTASSILKTYSSSSAIEMQKNAAKLEGDIEKVKATIAVNDGTDLFVNHDDYPDLFFKVSLGVQYDSVKTAFSQGHPRLGFLVYDSLFAPDIIDDDRGFGLYGIHSLVSALYTSSAEVSTPTNDPTAQVNLADKNAFHFELPIFLPLYRTPKHANNTLWEYSGPIVLLGGVKTDDSVRAEFRKYIGLRTALNPECYFDVLYGKTESLQSNRVEVRGQIPLYRTGNNTLIFVGITANVGVGDKRQNEADIVSTYISWDIDPKDIFTLVNPKKP